MAAPLLRPELEPHAAILRDAAPDGFVQTLKGHSGAQVALFAQGRNSLVRKTAGSPLQNYRLMRQSARQRELAAAGLRFPRVLREGVDEAGLAFFEMEYVPARSLATILCEASPLEAAPVERGLDQALRFFGLTAGGTLEAGLFQDKIAQIAATIAGPRVGALAARLAAMDWSGIPASLSHGDMTLENILLCPSRGMVFIDCDGAFASSWWLDVAKLCQDATGHWCMRELYRDQPGSAAWLNAVQRLDRMARLIEGLAARLDPGLPARLPQLTALHLLRTLPYAKDPALTEFVLARASHVLETKP